LNRGGLTYKDGSNRLTIDRLTGFKKARDERITNEVEQIIETGEVITYRYIPSELEYDDGITSLNVIEIAYNQGNIQTLLKEHQKRYMIQLMIILLVTAIMAYLIARWFAKPLYYAYHDSLTGLKNRTALEEDLQVCLESYPNRTAVLLLDLDNFKLVNDYFGHDEGDQVLRSTGRRIRRIIHEAGSVFRLGGDEFVIVLSNVSEQEAIPILDRLITRLQRKIPLPLEEEQENLMITASIGIVISGENDDVTSILKKADIALYESKQQGKNQYQFYHDYRNDHLSSL